MPDGAAPTLLKIAAENGIATLTLAAPERRNALSLAMLDELGDAIAGLSRTTDVKAVVLAAEGPVFCSGHDLKEITRHRSDPDGGRQFFETVMTRCAGVMMAMMASPKPFIAAVEGTATAAGCQLVATCDLAVATTESKFCTPGVHIGLFCSTPMVALSRNVPRKRALEMLMLGDFVGAADAAAWGLVNDVVAPGGAVARAHDMARRIASKSSRVLKIGKEAFYRQIDLPVAEAYRYAAEVMVENMLVPDAAEGIGAFLEKRAPDWPASE